MKRFKYEIKKGKAERVDVTGSGMTEIDAGLMSNCIDRALSLSGFKGNATIVKGERDKLRGEDEGVAITRWSLSNLFQTPTITLFSGSFVVDVGVPLGATLTHELIHCKQGFWRIVWENFLWTIGGRKGFPDIEKEAQNAINLW